jgi:hypothetical protein
MELPGTTGGGTRRGGRGSLYHHFPSKETLFEAPVKECQAGQAIRSRISLTSSIGVCGWRKANLATVSPSQADGGMKAT